MNAPKKTRSVKLGGSYYVERLCKKLVETSSWFAVEPLPDNEWEVYYKPERHPTVRQFMKEHLTPTFFQKWERSNP